MSTQIFNNVCSVIISRLQKTQIAFQLSKNFYQNFFDMAWDKGEVVPVCAMKANGDMAV
jgi:thiaminase